MGFYHFKKRYNFSPRGTSGNNQYVNKGFRTGEEWYRHFQQRYGVNNVHWKPHSFQDIIRNPKRLVGLSRSEVQRILGEGWTAGSYGSSGTGWKFTNGDQSVLLYQWNREGI